MNSAKTIVSAGMLTVVLCLTAAGLAATPAGDTSAFAIPTMSLARCDRPPLVDGVLTDGCWQTTQPVTGFHVYGKPGTLRPVNAWMTFDTQWLYIAFEITHPRPVDLKCTVIKHNGPVCNDDSIEVFLDPGTDGSLYFHYMLNALNVGAEKIVTKKAFKQSAGIPLRSGAQRTATGWTAELALPLSFMASYGDLAKLRMNLNLNLVTPRIDPYMAKIGEDVEWSSWAPVHTTFHEPQQFGHVQGLDDLTVQAPFLPQFAKVAVERYDLAAGQYSYAVTAELSSFFNQSGTVSVVVLDQPLQGKATESVLSTAVPSSGKQAVRVKVPVATLAARTAKVLLKDPQRGEVFQWEQLDAQAMAVLDLMTAFADRNYYTDEKAALAVCAFSLPASELAALTLAAKDSAGKILAQQDGLQAETLLPIPLDKLANGPHVLSIELGKKTGETLASQRITLVKRPPKPGQEWKIDQRQRVILHNGQPVFPFGIISGASLNDTEASERQIAEMAGIGFHTLMNFTRRIFPGQSEGLLAMAEKHKIFIMDSLDGYVSSNVHFYLKYSGPDKKLPEAERQKKLQEGYTAKLNLIRERVQSVMTSPALMGYFSIDEPSRVDDYDMCERGRAMYRIVNETDGYHPQYLNYSSLIPTGDTWTDWCDVLGTDPYWIPAGAKHRGTPNYMSRITWLTKQRADSVHKPTMIVPMSEYWSGCYKRMIQPQEQYCQTYLALIHGAKCLFYYAAPIRHQANFEALSRLARELKILGPIVVTPDIPQQISYVPGVFDPANGRLPDVQVALRANPKGGYVLLCANSQYYPVDVTNRLSSLKGVDTVGELFDPKKTYPVRDGAFADRLEPFGVRAYLIGQQFATAKCLGKDGTPDAGARNEGNAQRSTSNAELPIKTAGWKSEIGNQKSEIIKIAVSMVAHPELVQEETPEVPRSGRPGKKNVAPNPSFEEASLPGLPDYYYMALGLASGTRVGTPGAPYEQVSDNAYHGKYCVKIIGEKSSSPPQVRFYLAPKEYQPTQYVLSLYMRASREGARAGLYALQLEKLWKPKTFNVSTNWQRYYFTGTIPPQLDEYNQFIITAQDDDTTIWFDAIQMEKGSEPTAFEE